MGRLSEGREQGPTLKEQVGVSAGTGDSLSRCFLLCSSLRQGGRHPSAVPGALSLPRPLFKP